MTFIVVLSVYFSTSRQKKYLQYYSKQPHVNTITRLSFKSVKIDNRKENTRFLVQFSNSWNKQLLQYVGRESCEWMCLLRPMPLPPFHNLKHSAHAQWPDYFLAVYGQTGSSASGSLFYNNCHGIGSNRPTSLLLGQRGPHMGAANQQDVKKMMHK